MEKIDVLEKAGRYLMNGRFENAKEVKNKPVAIIADTVKGKGISFMEDKAGWHGKAPNEEEYNTAIGELNK